MKSCVPGFNRERLDPVSGTTHLGNGYRAYNPVLMRLNCPDSWSPFGDGGINPYAYCTGDPVNQADPSGHFSLGQWIGMGVGLLAGIALSIVTEGAAIPFALSLIATVAGDAFIGAGSEIVTEAVNGQRINWGQVGIAAGLSAASTLAGYGLGIASKMKGTSNRPFGMLMMTEDSYGGAGREAEIQQFIHENLEHRIDGPRMYSVDKMNPLNYFECHYTDERIILERIYRRVKTVPYKTSQVVKYQFNKIGTRTPKELVIQDVDPIILTKLKNLSGPDLTRTFQKTQFGPMTNHIMADFQATMENDVRINNNNFIISLKYNTEDISMIPDPIDIFGDPDDIFTRWDPSQGFIP